MANENQALVARITIGRLYNLGDYEHIRYDVTVEIPEGVEPSRVFQHLSNVMAGLNPKPKIDEWTLRSLHREIEEGSKADANEIAVQRKVDAEKRLEEHRKAFLRRQKAKQALNDLGGGEIFTDAKEKWDDEDRW